MLGESLALTGDIDGAAALWRTIPLEQDQLAIRQAWYDRTADQQAARWMRQAVIRLLSDTRDNVTREPLPHDEHRGANR
jgi:hypothetical protein